jgi:hypothetical protein
LAFAVLAACSVEAKSVGSSSAGDLPERPAALQPPSRVTENATRAAALRAWVWISLRMKRV